MGVTHTPVLTVRPVRTGSPETSSWELSVENVQMIMPSLLSLTIWSCPKLKSVPECLLAKLVTLKIRDCDGIIWMSSTSSLPCLAYLEKLDIWRTISLPHNGWEQLESLHTLDISFCNQLTSLPDQLGQLKSLHTLEIYECRQLESLPTSIGQLKSLQELYIQECDRLMSLPDELTQLQSLRTLLIEGCHRLESLPTSIGQLKSLQELSICECNQLRSLPDELTQLQALHTLHIRCCSQLRVVLRDQQQQKHLNCWKPSSFVARKVGGGEDWHKIKHIPNISIDFETIQQEKDG